MLSWHHTRGIVMKKKKSLLVFPAIGIILVIVLAIMSNSNNTANSTNKAFMVWMDGYIATSVNEQEPIAFTLFSEKDITPGEIVSINYENIDDITVDSFEISNMDQKYNDYWKQVQKRKEFSI